MNKISIFLLFVLFSYEASAQNTSGIINYNRKQDWIRISSHLPWVTQEDIDRDKLTWGKNQGDGSPYDLYFNNEKSVYKAGIEENNAGYSWNKEEYILIRDYKHKESQDIIETLGKKYIIEEVPVYKWKILNEIKEIEGYLCMKAETKDTVKDQTIYAWFTDIIPVQGGPEGFYGLPGMILEIDINGGDVIIAATKIVINSSEVDLPIPKKIKGKKISRADFNTLIKTYISDSIKSKRNPFWGIRY